MTRVKEHIADAAKHGGAGHWKRTGTTIEPKIAEDSAEAKNLFLNGASGVLPFTTNGFIKWSGGSGLSEQTVASGGLDRMLYTPNGDRFEILNEAGTDTIAGFHGANSATPDRFTLFKELISTQDITTTGNVGIGTAASTLKLDVLGTHVSGKGVASFKGDAEFGFLTLDTTTGGAGDEAGYLLNLGGVLVGQFGVRGDDTVYIKNRIFGESDVMTINSDGNVDFHAGNLTTTGNIVLDSDINEIKIGDDQDLTLRFNGTDAVIKTVTGNSANIILMPTGDFVHQRNTNNHTIHYISSGGNTKAAGFYLNNNASFPASSSESSYGMLASSTLDSMHEFIGLPVGNQKVFTLLSNRNSDHDHSTQDRPIIYHHSKTNPDTNNTEYGQMSHTGTGTGNGAYEILSGTGEISMGDDNLTTTGTIIGGGAKCQMTPIGGYAIKLTNTTGANTVAGQLVKADAATNDAVILTAANELECFGVFLDSGVADDAEAWVVVSGIADVAMEDNTTSTRGNWVRTSITEAGYADATNAATPQPINQTHFTEIGHCIETVTATGEGTHVSARCILHFN